MELRKKILEIFGYLIFLLYICIGIMKYVLIGYLVMVALGLITFAVGIKNAKSVDEKGPFLHDDYDPEEDQTLV